jgi:hypothetical protein
MRWNYYVHELGRWNRHSSCSVCLQIRLKRSNRIYSDRGWVRGLSWSFWEAILGEFLWRWQWNFWLFKTRCISRSTEQLSANCERLFLVGLGKILFQIRRELTLRHIATCQGTRPLTGQEIPHVFVYYGLQTRARVVSILIQRNPVYLLQCYLKSGFITIFLSTSRSSKRLCSSTFPNKIPVNICIFVVRGPCPAQIIILVLNTSIIFE